MLVISSSGDGLDFFSRWYDGPPSKPSNVKYWWPRKNNKNIPPDGESTVHDGLSGRFWGPKVDGLLTTL